MDGDRQARAQAVFALASGMPTAERTQFVFDACGDDPTLVAEVESLLKFRSDGASAGPTRGGPAPASAVAPALPAGLHYAGRYRIVELLGRGGMGEVYRAHDTVLDVAVALKRVILASAQDGVQIIREVRLARQVTHRAVCRVFDVGETGGEYYFTMEHIDGEDLGSLLRRIGRLPSLKAVDVARQACAGLAAAHARGILHRDLKPGNIMIDRRGDVRITDFGIAVQGPAGATLAGTPAYMAPEQLLGAPASARTDIYALALVLYELVTGRHAFLDTKGSNEGPPPPAARFAADVDPALDALIQRALDRDPAARPSSAIAFSAALPGGDLLQAALEAGQTPSPDLVAEAGAAGSLTPAAAGGLLVAAIAGIAMILATAQVRLIDQVAIPDPPAVMAASARAFVREVTGEPPAAHTAFQLQSSPEYLAYLAGSAGAPVDANRLALLLYRESPVAMVPWLMPGRQGPFDIAIDNPPLVTPGMKMVVLDSRGRLLQFRAVPVSSAMRGTPVDWTMFLRASGVDPATMTAEPPAGTAPPYADQRLAWRAQDEGSPAEFRIEAASSVNGPTFFDVHPIETPVPAPGRNRMAAMVGAVISAVWIVMSLFLARRNVMAGRADVRGARRLALALFFCQIAAWLLGTSFLPFESEFERFMTVAAIQFVTALLAASFYLAFEPTVRRRWPWSLISWSRLLAGGFRDPIVGRDVLIGAAASIAGSALYQVLVAAGIGLRGDRPADLALPALMGVRQLVSGLLLSVPASLSSAMILVLLYTLLVMVFRRGWVAAVAMVALLATLVSLQALTTPVEVVVLMIALSLFVLVFMRFGLLALTSYQFFDTILSRFPLSFASDWRSEFAVVTLLVAVGILAAAAYVSTRSTRHADLAVGSWA